MVRTLEQPVDCSQAGAHVVLHPRVSQHVRHGRALRRVGLQHDAQQVRAFGRHLQAPQSQAHDSRTSVPTGNWLSGRQTGFSINNMCQKSSEFWHIAVSMNF